MTEQNWKTLLDIINGEIKKQIPAGFIIDCPWLPNWYGVDIIDYFTNDEIWFDANMKAINEFSDTIFLPGFWSEYGMCTEPSAFGVRCTFPRNEFPHAHKIINTSDDIENLVEPNPKTDGLLPFMLNRLRINQNKIEKAGHSIKFSVSRGPLNIASYLMGTTEFLTLILTDPDKAELLLKKITSFLKNWHELQFETFPSIEGIFMLDDIIGFMGEEEFKQFGLPYFKEIYNLNPKIKFLHNDAPCKVSAPYLNQIGINLFNMGYDISLNELKELTQNKITLLGNLPPRDVLASETPENVYLKTKELISTLNDKSRLILSCGGGMPPGVSTENINAFLKAVNEI
ncbi:MAG: uroporphyrinogen decarboxylase [Melioribacteraceae bacterium]|nr:uroporphyrinogen decarboxylase [Melioribacteraceae bacterium]